MRDDLDGNGKLIKMPRMSGRPAEVAAAIRTALELDREWQRSPAGRDDPACTPWMPFPLFDFIALVAEAMPEVPGDRFLEIGAGIGTRMLLAQQVFGLDAWGIERVPEYAAQAEKLGLDVYEADALDFTEYGDFDLLWFNRPFRDRERQAELEARVWQDMHSGAVVIAANLEDRPPRSWWLVLDDWEVRRGIWQKQ